jgi:hypothetical protein
MMLPSIGYAVVITTQVIKQHAFARPDIHSMPGKDGIETNRTDPSTIDWFDLLVPVLSGLCVNRFAVSHPQSY